MNPTSIHEDAGLIPGPAHWVKDLVLLGLGLGRRPATVAMIRSLAWATGMALKWKRANQKNQQQKKNRPLEASVSSPVLGQARSDALSPRQTAPFLPPHLFQAFLRSRKLVLGLAAMEQSHRSATWGLEGRAGNEGSPSHCCFCTSSDTTALSTVGWPWRRGSTLQPQQSGKVFWGGKPSSDHGAGGPVSW